MKFPIALFSAFFVAVLFDVRLAASQTAATKKGRPLADDQPAGDGGV
jgi:hypothetical protein